MAAHPPVLRKDLFRNSWIREESSAQSQQQQGVCAAPTQPDALILSGPPAHGARSPRAVALHSAGTNRSSRVSSAKSRCSHVSVAASAATTAGSRQTIFTPRKTNDPLYQHDEPHPSCTNPRCRHLIETQCGFRLLPAYQGTFGPPKPFSPRQVYPAVAQDDEEAVPTAQAAMDELMDGGGEDAGSHHERGVAAVTKQKPSVAAREAQRELVAFEANLSKLSEKAASMEALAVAAAAATTTAAGTAGGTSLSDRAVVGRNGGVVIPRLPPGAGPSTTAGTRFATNAKSGEPFLVSVDGGGGGWPTTPSWPPSQHQTPKTSLPASRVGSARPGGAGSNNGGSSAATLQSRATRHAWILNALEEEGRLNRNSTFVAAKGFEVRRRLSRRDSTGSISTIAAGAVAQQQQSGAAAALSEVARIDIASNFVVALLVKFTTPMLLMEYKRFSERHRPVSAAMATRTAATSSSFLSPTNPTATQQQQQQQQASSSLMPPRSSSFVVHHQSGLTLPQFALFLEEAVAHEMNTTVHDLLISQDRFRLAFRTLADPASMRVLPADLIASFALAVVPPVAQENAEYFVNLFDPEGSGYVPRTIFHHLLVHKYIERNVPPGMLPVWQRLEAILRGLLTERHPGFEFVLNEVLTATLTPLARSRLTIDTQVHRSDDPAGLFSTRGESRPLAITIREALCVIYGLEQLCEFFQHNSLDLDKYLRMTASKEGHWKGL